MIAGAALLVVALGVAGLWALFFRQPTTGSLEARVTKLRNAPVTDTRVALQPVDPDGSTVEARTDAAGRFAFADVEEGLYTLSVAYGVGSVFECDVRYSLAIRAEATLVRRFRVPLVDVAPGGNAKLGKGRKAKTARCRTLHDPVRALLCQGSQMPIEVFALPPRIEMNVSGYRRLGTISERACSRVAIVGRLPGASPLTYRPLGWLFVAVAGTPRLRGWIFPVVRALGAEHRAWWDVAEARAARLPKATPTLRGGGLPDLSFTTPREAQHAGDPCFTPGLVGAEWVVNVRNTGRGLAPKRFELFIDNGFQTELRHLGDAAWVRGTAPGETVPIGISYDEPGNHTYLGLNAYTRLRLDPDDKVKESNETNNELSLGYLPQLTCVSVP